jgi:hypothetical protein
MKVTGGQRKLHQDYFHIAQFSLDVVCAYRQSDHFKDERDDIQNTRRRWEKHNGTTFCYEILMERNYFRNESVDDRLT